MKLATSLFAAATLLASYVSSIPLDQPASFPGLSIRTTDTSKIDCEIAEPIESMFRINKGQLQGICQTNGGWELAVQVLLENEFRKSFKLSRKDYLSLREKAVYTDSSMAADFLLPSIDPKNGKKGRNGMIIELKCENINFNAGAKMQSKVQGDINKVKKLKDEYKNHKFVVVAMAYSTQAETALTTGLQLQVIPGAVMEIEERDLAPQIKEGSDTEIKEGSDTEMKEGSDTKSDSGKSDKSHDSQGMSSSAKSLKVKAYQKEIDPQAPDTNKKAPTRTSDRQKAQSVQDDTN